MSLVASIVEGDGEVAALPVLLRRLGEWKTPDLYVHVLPPIRVRKDRFLNRAEEFNRHLQLAAAKYRRLAVVLANREYEAWFIAAAASLDGFRNFHCQPDDGFADAETPRNAKGWIGERIAGGAYHQTTDQAAFSARMDLEVAYARSRSFRKLCSEWSRNVTGVP